MAIHVAHLVESLDVEFGGLSRAVAEISSALTNSGISSSIITFRSSNAQIPTTVPTYRVERRDVAFGIGKLGFWSEPSFLARYVEQHAVDVLHVHGLWRMQSVYAARLAQRTALPIVFSPHGMLSRSALHHSRVTKSLFWRFLEHQHLRDCDRLHVTSEDEELQVKAFLPEAKVVCAPLGVAIPSETSFPPRSRTILFLGRIAPIKNLESLIGAWQEALRTHDMESWRLVIAGPGEAAYLAHLRSLAANVPNVEFSGLVYQEEKELLISSSSALVLPSLSENFGIAAAEALALGTPVICSKGTPWRSAAEAGCGYWVEGSVQALAAAMVSLASLDAAQWSRMCVAAVSYARNHLNIDKNMQKLAAAYADVVNGRQ